MAQLRAVFSIPLRAQQDIFTDLEIPQHLAYVEWFTRFPNTPHSHHGMYRVSRSFKDGIREAAIIPVNDIFRSVMLFPRFGPIAPRDWTSDNVLEECKDFYVNPYVDEHMYRTIY